jgi:hypothetical protein
MLADWSEARKATVGTRYTKPSTQCNLSIALRRSAPSELWPTFQPTRQRGRSILIGVGQSRHQCRDHGRAGTRLQHGLDSTNAVYGLSSGTWPPYHTPIGDERTHELLLGFFGGGMPARAWLVAADRAVRGANVAAQHRLRLFKQVSVATGAAANAGRWAASQVMRTASNHWQ